MRDMQNRCINYSLANLQSEIFPKVMTIAVEVPGDWHINFNQLQSIYNLYYVVFLNQFQDLLSWKRINKDVQTL